MVTTTRASPLSSQSRLKHSPNTRQTLHTATVLVPVETRTAAVCDMLFMHEIDGSDGEDNPPRVKRTRRVFPRPTYEASSACALRCSGAANSRECVRSQATAVVDHFSRQLCSETICKFIFHYKAIFYAVGFVSRTRPFSTEAQIGLSYAVEKGLFRLNFFRLRNPTGGSSRKTRLFRLESPVEKLSRKSFTRVF